MHDTGECSMNDLSEVLAVSRPTVYRTLNLREVPWRTISPLPESTRGTPAPTGARSHGLCFSAQARSALHDPKFRTLAECSSLAWFYVQAIRCGPTRLRDFAIPVRFAQSCRHCVPSGAA